MSQLAPKSGEYSEGKLWFTRKANVVTIGLTSLGLEDVGSVQSVELPDEGDDYEKGDTVVTVDGSSGKLEVSAPATGVIQEINKATSSEPDLVTEDPLEEGWLVKMEVQDPSDLKEFG